MKLKKILKEVLPQKWVESIKYYRYKKVLKEHFLADYRKYLKYSCNMKTFTSKTVLLGDIVRSYHVLEKGLTMPKRRLGFGKDRVKDLIIKINSFIELYGVCSYQIKCAVGVLNEYVDIHQKKQFALDLDIVKKIQDLSMKVTTSKHRQIFFTKEKYFVNKESSFAHFSNSRHSVRSFKEDEQVSKKSLVEAIKLAQNTPSACNRQSWRVNLVSDKEKIKDLLAVQGGARGFDYLVDKLLVVSSELGVFVSPSERNQAYIDGGIYVMNLLYSLHCNSIAACTLNCCLTIEKDIQLRKLLKVDSSAVLIAMIACGNPTDTFEVARSSRDDYEKILRITK